MQIRDAVKFMMFQYPSLYKNPIDALIQLFCVHGDWTDDGDMYIHDYKELTKIKRELPHDMSKRETLECLKSLNIGYELENQATIAQWDFIESNIDSILSAPLINVYFGQEPHGHYFTKGISENYAAGIHFPDNIQQDWAKVLYKFLEHWLYRLNCEYGVGSEKVQTLHWWPKDVLKAREMILAARDRLHPIVHSGETYEQMNERMLKLFAELD